MTINRSDIAKQLVPGLNAVFGSEYKSIDNEHTVLFDTESSDRAFEEQVLFSGLGAAPVKNEGAAVQYDDMTELWTARWTHETIALAFGITEEAMEDNLYDTYSKMQSKALGRSMATTKQTKASDVFNNGFNTATAYKGGDGVPLFSASHPTRSAGLQSNTVSADLSETALENALISIGLMKDDRDILIGSQAVSLHIPPQLIFTATRILKSDLRVGTADNDTNALKEMGYFSKGYHVNHRFTDNNAWFIRTDVPYGTQMFTRVPLQTRMEGDFDTGNMRYKARERYSFGWSNWRNWHGSNGSS